MTKKIFHFNYYLLIFLILQLLFSGCSNNAAIKDYMNLSITVKKINAWVNLMPGFSENQSIHVSGKFIIYNAGKTDIKQLKLKGVKILQDDKERNFEHFALTPIDTIDFIPESKKEFSFSAATVVNEKTKINYNSFAKVVFFYSSFNRNYIDTVENILITKAY